jgi:hypothetical protein
VALGLLCPSIRWRDMTVREGYKGHDGIGRIDTPSPYGESADDPPTFLARGKSARVVLPPRAAPSQIRPRAHVPAENGVVLAIIPWRIVRFRLEIHALYPRSRYPSRMHHRTLPSICGGEVPEAQSGMRWLHARQTPASASDKESREERMVHLVCRGSSLQTRAGNRGP